MHFFKHTISSENRVNAIKEDLQQRASSQKPSVTPQNLPGMAQPLTRPLFRRLGASVSPPKPRQEHSNAVSHADAGSRSRVQGTATQKKQGASDNTVETTSQLVKDITSRCDTVLERAQNLLTRAGEQEELVNRVLEEHNSRSRVFGAQSEERIPLRSPSKSTQQADTDDGSVSLNVPLSPPVSQKTSGWFSWVPTPKRQSRSASLPCPPPTPATAMAEEGHASLPSETPSSPSLLRRVCRSIQRLSQHLVSPAPTSATQTPPCIDEPAAPGGDEDDKTTTSTVHRKSVLFLGPEKLESVTPTKIHHTSSSSSSPKELGPAPVQDGSGSAAGLESASSTLWLPAPLQSAVKRFRSPRASSPSASAKSDKAGAKRSKTETDLIKQKQRGESPTKRASPSQSPTEKLKLTVADSEKSLAVTPLASARSSTPRQGSNAKWQEHLEMVKYIQTNTIKKCLSNFTKAELLKFLHSEGVAHMSDELNKRQLLDEARALVNKERNDVVQ